jgi:hypothetical protein
MHLAARFSACDTKGTAVCSRSNTGVGIRARLLGCVPPLVQCCGCPKQAGLPLVHGEEEGHEKLINPYPCFTSTQSMRWDKKLFISLPLFETPWRSTCDTKAFTSEAERIRRGDSFALRHRDGCFVRGVKQGGGPSGVR